MSQHPHNINGQTPVTVTITVADINTVIMSLAKRPYEEVVGLIQTLQAQTQSCINALMHTSPPPPPAESAGADPGAVG